MHVTPIVGAAALFAGLGILFFDNTAPATATDVEPPATATAEPSTPPAAPGHLVLVVEGDRDQLTITHANRKQDAWAGNAKGLASAWQLSLRDGNGVELAAVPLDMSPFDLDPARKGGPLQVQGCIVRDPHVAMLVNAPALADVASYVFLRGDVTVGTIAATEVDRLAGGGR
ncbi:MAG: hypothetical protein KDC98_03650 [Planctomycetes bacterium]|nr:hypothetical protein [Planctomycetota bacterium]